MKQIHGGDIYRHKGVLDFSSNVNPLGTPQSVIDAAARSLKMVEHYPDIHSTALRAALGRYENVPGEQIILGNGAAEIIFSFVRALNPKKALLAAPTFAEYGLALKSAGCEIKTYPMKDLKIGCDFTQYLSGGVECAFICNPNNPTGFLTDSTLLEDIIRVCTENKIYLLLDECFLDFVEQREKLSMKRLLNESGYLLILNSFTKRYAMAGLRLGYALSSDRKLLDAMEAVCQPWNISIPAQAAGEAALGQTLYLERSRALVNEQRKFLKEEMKKNGLEVYDSKSNYIFFKGPEDLYDRFLEKGILIRDCSNYEGLSGGYFRIAVRCKEENIRLIDALGAIMQSVR